MNKETAEMCVRKVIKGVAANAPESTLCVCAVCTHTLTRTAARPTNSVRFQLLLFLLDK